MWWKAPYAETVIGSRVTTELVDARTDETLWSDSYDRDLTDIFAIQIDIAQTVASKLSACLSEEEKRGIQEKPTENLEAYDLYLRAEDLITNAIVGNIGDSRASLLYAIKLLEEATHRDSHFALAYCLIVKANDWLYLRKFALAERRAQGDAAVNQALRIKPDLPEIYLAAAFHNYVSYRDYERARVQIEIARQALPNSADVFALTGYLDRRQGRWSQSTKSLEEASDLDPRNPEILLQLMNSYGMLRQYRNCEKIVDRMIALMPEEPAFKVEKARVIFDRDADLASYRAVLEALVRDDKDYVSERIRIASFARDWTAAHEILNGCPNQEFSVFNNSWWDVPRACLEIWLAHTEGDDPAMKVELEAGRVQLKQKVEANPEESQLLSTLGMIDAFLGRKEEAIQEARHAVEMLPISRDALEGPSLVANLAIVYASTNEVNLALLELTTLIKTPGSISYGELKLDPDWDLLRKDARFDELLAQLAPKQ